MYIVMGEEPYVWTVAGICVLIVAMAAHEIAAYAELRELRAERLSHTEHLCGAGAAGVVNSLIESPEWRDDRRDRHRRVTLV